VTEAHPIEPDQEAAAETVVPAPDPGPRSQLPNIALLVAALVAIGLSASLPTILIIVGLIVMIFLHELGHYLTAKAAGMKVTEFFLGFGPRLWSFRRGETEYGVKLIPAGAYVRIIGMSNLDEVDPADEERTYRAKPYWRRLSVAVAGSTMHFILALLLVWSVFSAFGTPDGNSDRWTVRDVSPHSPAAAVGLRPGDRIVTIDGKPAGDFTTASTQFKAHPGQEVTLVVDRGERELTLRPTLADHHPETGEAVGFLGIGPKVPTTRMNPAAGLWHAGAEFGTMAKQSVIGLRDLFSPSGVTSYVDHVTGRSPEVAPGAVDTGRPSSVVGIVQVGSELGKEGLINIVYLLFGVNIFIGIFNLTPLLPFDGGHVVIATYEKIRSLRTGRRYHADVTKLLPLTYAVVLLLGLLFVTSIYLDVFDPQHLG
jgi:membrane-associated protease RseP (regulator of RpoE activity)